VGVYFVKENNQNDQSSVVIKYKTVHCVTCMETKNVNCIS